MKHAPILCGLALILAGCQSTPLSVEAPGALGPYSDSVAHGPLVFVSGKIGTRGDTFAIEAQSAIDAVERALAEHGLSLSDVVSVTVFLTDLDDYAQFNAVYSERFAAPYPARAVAGSSALPGAARVEIQVIAAR
ncbi:MAG: 2-iminobutanoate/2-iminopropanoate deaminase [Phycisphaerales bacterium]|jgi:2-iminobutanoate/2-iminopropanoate deaminase